MIIPEQLSANCHDKGERQAWLDSLPAMLEELTGRWSLRTGPPFEHANVTCSWVAPVVCGDGRSAVLKLGMPHMEEMCIRDSIQSPQAAAAALDPVRARLLAELSEPASAATLAARLSLPRQKVNYHLRALESHHLVRPTSERKWGGITERLVEATASSYVVSPAAMGPAASDPGRSRDRLSAGYLIALAARVVREVSDLANRARETGKRLATLSIDTEIRFRSAAERAQFSSELTAAITQLAARYHDASARCV